MAKSKDKEVEKKEVENKSVFAEFKEFVIRGNVIELAIGLTVGTAFTRVVNSLVNNLVMPVISIFLNGEAFSDLYINLSGDTYDSLAAAEEAGAAVIKYGQLIADLLDFLIIALVIFAVIKIVGAAKKKSKKD